MKKLLGVACVVAIILIAILLIWSPIDSVSVDVTTSSKTSMASVCKVNGERCPNVVMWYHWKDPHIGTKTWTYTYGGAKAGWLKVKGLGGIHRENNHVEATITKPLLVHSAANGSLQVINLHEELVYGSFGKKGKFRVIKDSLWVGHGAPLKRKLKTTKGGKKHWVDLSTASLSFTTPVFGRAQYPFKN